MNFNTKQKAIVAGAGLAGCEAAWQLAKRNVFVDLFDIKPKGFTKAHKYGGFAELVCSNSFRAESRDNAIGLLKEELKILGSLIMETALDCRVAAGGALAVDRKLFSDKITEKIKSNPFINFTSKEITKVPKENVIVATGPLTTPALFDDIKIITGSENLYFFDAAAPIISYESIDFTSAFFASRYDKGDGDYINCPLTESEYLIFYNELINAEATKEKDIDKNVFEGCMPLEVMAKRGFETLLYGPLKPVGLKDPKTEKQPFAVVQLRKDNKEGTLYNMVGFQTHLTFKEQKRVFSLIPALKNAVFERFGVMHRNTYINSPYLLLPVYALKNTVSEEITKQCAKITMKQEAYTQGEYKNVFFAGQMTGVEGYIESVSSGFLAGINLANILLEKQPVIFPAKTAIGALARYVSGSAAANFQPMNASFGIMDTAPIKNKKQRIEETARLSIEYISNLSF